MKNQHKKIMKLSYKKLTVECWSDFVKLFGKYSGVRGGCWCAYYLGRPKDFVFSEKDLHRDIHHEHVKKFGSTGILVYDEETPIGYCQVAKYDVIERFNYSKQYQELTNSSEYERCWRISCFFVDKEYRKQKLSTFMFDSAIDYIAHHGGGMLEVFPFKENLHPTNKFNFNGSVQFYLKRGFQEYGTIGTASLVMIKYINNL